MQWTLLDKAETSVDGGKPVFVNKYVKFAVNTEDPLDCFRHVKVPSIFSIFLLIYLPKTLLCSENTALD